VPLVLGSVLMMASVSKVPFYIAGGALAVWAVVLSALGLTRPSFPYNVKGQRGVIAISFVLMVVAMAMAVHTSTFD
jgi:hypothetical protein